MVTIWEPAVAVLVGVAVAGRAVAVGVDAGEPVVVGAAVRVAEGAEVLVAPPAVWYEMTSLGAPAGEPSLLSVNMRPQGEPVPVRMTDRLLPLCQSGRLTTAWTTGAISSRLYQVLASHWTSD